MYYLQDPQTDEVIRHANTEEKAKSLKDYLLNKGIKTVITKNGEIID